jgi:hypothetical protein
MIEREALSSNHLSVELQAADVVRWFRARSLDNAARFNTAWPDYDALQWSGSWVDTEASGVDVEYMSWLIDWLEQEQDGLIWEDGEPWFYPNGFGNDDD